MGIKERRKALGLSRAELAEKAYVDRSLMQLLEMEMNKDEATLDRLDKTLTALESGAVLPDWESIVEAEIEAEGGTKFRT